LLGSNKIYIFSAKRNIKYDDNGQEEKKRLNKITNTQYKAIFSPMLLYNLPSQLQAKITQFNLPQKYIIQRQTYNRQIDMKDILETGICLGYKMKNKDNPKAGVS